MTHSYFSLFDDDHTHVSPNLVRSTVRRGKKKLVTIFSNDSSVHHDRTSGRLHFGQSHSQSSSTADLLIWPDEHNICKTQDARPAECNHLMGQRGNWKCCKKVGSAKAGDEMRLSGDFVLVRDSSETAEMRRDATLHDTRRDDTKRRGRPERVGRNEEKEKRANDKEDRQEKKEENEESEKEIREKKEDERKEKKNKEANEENEENEKEMKEEKEDEKKEKKNKEANEENEQKEKDMKEKKKDEKK
ncbi:unnamed protein product [Protopolystoma xenopodis]|uniref:Uncharacterized protein n=1 Tax=Protopolystoma xenopodis TaxID=117903 RepID=A0A448WQ48_9PLAT|nr:unnamed protein product [Protopolystoma xenopodis]